MDTCVYAIDQIWSSKSDTWKCEYYLGMHRLIRQRRISRIDPQYNVSHSPLQFVGFRCLKSDLYEYNLSKSEWKHD